jgi:hypothetical protein
LSKNIKFKTYKTTILPLVVCGSDIWSLTLRKEHILRVFGKRVVRRIFEPKSEEITGSRIKLQNEKLHNVCSSSDIMRLIKSRRVRWALHVARMRGEVEFVGFCRGT